jgi:hypothetical protein
LGKAVGCVAQPTLQRQLLLRALLLLLLCMQRRHQGRC